MQMQWSLLINKYLKQLINAVIAGLLMGLAGTAYLYCLGIGNQVLGSFLFGFGFLFIALYGYELYTNKAGYMVENKWIYILDCLIAILGNIIGTWLIALVLKMTSFLDAGSAISCGLGLFLTPKIGDALVFDYFGRSLLGGLIMYITYNTYKKAEQPIARFMSLFLGAFFITFLGLDEFVSDMFMFNTGILVGYEGGFLITHLVYVFIGNTLGALIIPALRKLKGVLKSI